VLTYAKHAEQEHLLRAVPANHVAPVTIACAVVTFVVILIAGRSRGGPVALASAAIGAVAAPMIFELPFDLIVMSRTYPALPPDPALYRVLFFAPLFLVELTTLALLALSPMVRVSRAAFCWFALMLVIFAVWALTGFAYPSEPIPFTLNVTSKIIAFAAALSLFLSRRLPSAPSGPAPRRSRQQSGDGSLDQVGDLLFDHGTPVLERVRHRPEVPVVEVGRVLEAQGRVAVAELAGVLKEDDDLAVRVGVRRHPVPGLGQQLRGGRGHGHMDALGECTIFRCHLRDLVEHRLQPVGLFGTLLTLGAQLGGAFLHRCTLRGAEAVSLALRIVRRHSASAFRRSWPGPVPAT
jgi:hypothetical protein